MFIEEVKSWFDAMSVAERDGFALYEGDNSCFVLWFGNATRVVEYGPGIMQRALDAALELLAEDEERADRCG